MLTYDLNKKSVNLTRCSKVTSHWGQWLVTCDLWPVTCDLWLVTCDLWLVTCDLWLVTFLWREVINRLTWTFMSGQMTTGVFLKRSPTIQKKGAKTCSYWFLFFFNETPISSLVKNDMTLGVWIEKDRRTIGTGDAGVFLIRYPTIQKKWTRTCSYWFLFFSHEKHTICLVKNTIPQAVWIEKKQKNNLNRQCMGFLDKRCDGS